MPTNSKTLGDLITEVADKYSPCQAIATSNSSLTYEELKKYSQSIFFYIIQNIHKPKGIIACYLPKSKDSITVMLGVLQAGYTFWGIDSRWSPDVINSLIKYINPLLVITNDILLQNIEPSPCPCTSIENISVNHQISIPQKNTHLDDPAYIVATSGTTIKPKFVAISHSSITNTIEKTINYLSLPSQSRIAHLSNFAFDMSIFEILLSLLSGGTLCIPSSTYVMAGKKLCSFLIEEKIDLSITTPTILATIPNKEIPSLKKLILGGEPLTPELIRVWLPKKIDIYNGYGTAETAICIMLNHIFKHEDYNCIGKPFAGVILKILDKDKREVGTNTPGELYVGGKSLAPEYYNQEEMTKKKFVKLEHQGEQIVFFKTGDFVQMNDKGELIFLYRSDNEIKINGIRIVPEYVTDILLKHPHIKHAILLKNNQSKREKLIVAFSSHDNVKIKALELKNYLLKFFPKQAIPSHYIHVKRWPVDFSGKVDKKILSNMLREEIPFNNTEPVLI